MRPMIALLALVLLALPISAGAQHGPPGDGPPRGDSDAGGDGERRQSPPPEALDVCRGASEGATCVFDSPHGTIDGTCRRPPDHDTMACVPDDHRGGPGGGGGREAGGPGGRGGR